MILYSVVHKHYTIFYNEIGWRERYLYLNISLFQHFILSRCVEKDHKVVSGGFDIFIAIGE